MRHSLVLAAALLVCGCSSPAPEPQPLAQTPRRAPAVAAQKPVVISPAVAALMAPDPDLDKKMTPEEVKATLAAAQSQAPSTAPVIPALTLAYGKSEWNKLEDEKAAKKAAYEQRLTGTYVFSDRDGRYHTGGCSALYENMIDRFSRQILSRRFIGNQITLAYAKSSGLGRHDACGAPSYDYP